MLKIIKYGVEYRIPQSSIASITSVYDGLRVVLNDGTEISFQFSVTPQFKAVIPFLTNVSMPLVELNLDKAISGEYDKVLKLVSIETPNLSAPEANNSKNVNTKTTTTEDKPRKRRGRPSKSSK